MEEIIVEKTNEGIFVCILENGKIVEKYTFDTEKSARIGNIYMGTVRDVLDGMQVAFVDVGLDKNVFLSLKDAMPKVDEAKENERKVTNEKQNTRISNVLKRGQRLLLQIRKEAIGDKGARVSSHITLAGNYLVIMPNTEIITISQKIEDKDEKTRLLNIVKNSLPPNYGCIVRTDACEMSESKIVEDMKKTIKLWEEVNIEFSKICKEENNIENKLLYDNNDIILKIARDMVKKTTKKIYVNDRDLYYKLKIEIDESIIVYKEKNDFVEEFGLAGELKKSDNRKIWLDSGAQIVIDKTEALTAIDVNSGKCVGKEDLNKTIYKINKEAAVEVMKQLRLKDIGGIIIIDYIDMSDPDYKEEIINIMKEERKKDRSKIEIKGFTQLNLVEMTRKKMYV